MSIFSGSCPCAQLKSCEDLNQSCNCDKIDAKWSSDDGYFNEPHSLGITNMYFLQQKNLDDESQGRITLGPLECVETSMKFNLEFKRKLNNNFFLYRYSKVCRYIHNIAIIHRSSRLEKGRHCLLVQNDRRESDSSVSAADSTELPIVPCRSDWRLSIDICLHFEHRNN